MSEPFVFDPRCDLCKEPFGAVPCMISHFIIGDAVPHLAPWPRRAFPTAHWSSPVSFPGRSGSRNYPWRASQASGFAFPAH